jgi:hypothetical protein
MGHDDRHRDQTGSYGHDATRRSYDAVAGAYADGLRDELAGKPLDRALLTALLEQAPPGTGLAAPSSSTAQSGRAAGKSSFGRSSRPGMVASCTSMARPFSGQAGRGRFSTTRFMTRVEVMRWTPGSEVSLSSCRRW